MYNHAQNNANFVSISVETVRSGSATFGMRSVASRKLRARKKLRNTKKKSRGILIMENIISCFFMNAL